MFNAASQRQVQSHPQFTLMQRQIPRQHTVQFYLDHGHTSAGPWFKLGINDIEYIVGFVPRQVAKKAHLRPVGGTV